LLFVITPDELAQNKNNLKRFVKFVSRIDFYQLSSKIKYGLGLSKSEISIGYPSTFVNRFVTKS
jgi:hypothetical protein